MGKRESAAVEKRMPLTGHLKELRNRAVACLICFAIAFFVCLNYASDIVERLTDIGRSCGYRFVYIAPQELLMEYFGVALIAGLCIASPVILYQIWAFARPALRRKDNILVALSVLFGLAFFVLGVLFAYKIMTPFMLEFLIGVNAGTYITPSVSVQNYMSFLITIHLIFGAVFELPVLSVLLTQLGIVKVAWMKKGRRGAIVVIFFLAAVITPPDVASQIMVAIPMVSLYELSVLVCSLLMKLKRRKKNDDEQADARENGGLDEP